MKILIDADGCPVVDITINIAKRNHLECIILCDTSHEFVRNCVKTITVSKGNDSVDYALVNMVQKGDIVITQDYGLAAMCLARNAVPISQNGMIFTNDNIDALLFARYTARKIRNAGGRIKGQYKRTIDQDKKFAEVLNSLILIE